MDQTNYPLYNGIITPNLAKRLAEAIDGLRNNNKFYFLVCKLEYPYEMEHTPGSTSIDIENEKADSLIVQKSIDGKQFYKFGSYITAAEQDYHPLTGHDKIEIRFLNTNEVLHSEILSNDTDAVLFSLSAYDKFFLPYYTRIYGLNIVADLRNTSKRMLSGEKIRQQPIYMIKHADGTSSNDT